MDEYINRDDLLKAAWEKPTLSLSVYDIGNIKPADVSPVRHGMWIEKEKYTFGVMCDCSICDNRILDAGHSWNYCPNCGAKMGGGAD